MSCRQAPIRTSKNSAKRGPPKSVCRVKQKKAGRNWVGAMAVAALIIFAVLVFVLTSSHGLFNSNTNLYTYLDDSAAIAAARRCG